MPRFSWKIGRVEGIDLYLHPTFLILLAWTFAFQGGVLAAALTVAVFGCVVLHELGHALMARYYGIQTADITLYPIGGVARLERMPRAAGPEFLIAVAGPLVNFVIAGGLALGLWIAGPAGTDNLFGEMLSQLLTLNLILGLFNLIPAFPMDGGRILRALLSTWLGRLRATTIAAKLGQALAIFAGSLGLFYGEFMFVALALFIYFAGGTELLSVRFDEMTRNIAEGADPFLQTPPPGFRWESRGDGVWTLAPKALGRGTYEP